MFSVFPELFTFSFLAIGVFRIAVGLLCVYMGVAEWKSHRDIFGLARAIVGGFLVVGLFTQIAVLALAALLIWDMGKKGRSDIPHSRQLDILLLASLFVLLFIGPGIFALDVPF